MTDKAPKPNEYTDDDYRYLLKRIGAPTSPQNLAWMRSWKAAEVSDYEHNPFNTTQYVTGAKNPSGSIQSYKNREAGLNATADTLLYAGKGSYYKNVVKGLRAGDPKSATEALVKSPWAAGKYGGAEDWTKSSVWQAYQRNQPTPAPRQFNPESTFQQKMGSPKTTPVKPEGNELSWVMQGPKAIGKAAISIGSEITRQAINVGAMTARNLFSNPLQNPETKTYTHLETGKEPFRYQVSNAPRTSGAELSDLGWTLANTGGAELVKAGVKAVLTPMKAAREARAAEAARFGGSGVRVARAESATSGVPARSTLSADEIKAITSKGRPGGWMTGTKTKIAGAGLAALATLAPEAATLAKSTTSMSRAVEDLGKTVESSRGFKVQVPEAPKPEMPKVEAPTMRTQAGPEVRPQAESFTPQRASTQAASHSEGSQWSATQAVTAARTAQEAVAQTATQTPARQTVTSSAPPLKPQPGPQVPPKEPPPEEPPGRRLPPGEGSDMAFSGQPESYGAVY